MRVPFSFLFFFFFIENNPANRLKNDHNFLSSHLSNITRFKIPFYILLFLVALKNSKRKKLGKRIVVFFRLSLLERIGIS